MLFALIWWFSSKPRPRMTVSGLFVLAYGVYRFFIEFVRQPDAHLGFVAMDWLTMGQLLSFSDDSRGSGDDDHRVPAGDIRRRRGAARG